MKAYGSIACSFCRLSGLLPVFDNSKASCSSSCTLTAPIAHDGKPFKGHSGNPNFGTEYKEGPTSFQLEGTVEGAPLFMVLPGAPNGGYAVSKSNTPNPKAATFKLAKLAVPDMYEPLKDFCSTAKVWPTEGVQGAPIYHSDFWSSQNGACGSQPQCFDFSAANVSLLSNGTIASCASLSKSSCSWTHMSNVCCDFCSKAGLATSELAISNNMREREEHFATQCNATTHEARLNSPLFADAARYFLPFFMLPTFATSGQMNMSVYNQLSADALKVTSCSEAAAWGSAYGVKKFDGKTSAEKSNVSMSQDPPTHFDSRHPGCKAEFFGTLCCKTCKEAVASDAVDKAVGDNAVQFNKVLAFANVTSLDWTNPSGKCHDNVMRYKLAGLAPVLDNPKQNLAGKQMRSDFSILGGLGDKVFQDGSWNALSGLTIKEGACVTTAGTKLGFVCFSTLGLFEKFYNSIQYPSSSCEDVVTGVPDMMFRDAKGVPTGGPSAASRKSRFDDYCCATAKKCQDIDAGVEPVREYMIAQVEIDIKAMPVGSSAHKKAMEIKTSLVAFRNKTKCEHMQRSDCMFGLSRTCCTSCARVMNSTFSGGQGGGPDEGSACVDKDESCRGVTTAAQCTETFKANCCATCCGKLQACGAPPPPPSPSPAPSPAPAACVDTSADTCKDATNVACQSADFKAKCCAKCKALDQGGSPSPAPSPAPAACVDTSADTCKDATIVACQSADFKAKCCAACKRVDP